MLKYLFSLYIVDVNYEIVSNKCYLIKLDIPKMAEVWKAAVICFVIFI